MMRHEGVRQSDRVQLRVTLEVSWDNPAGETVAQSVETLLVSKNGAVLKLAEKLDPGHLLTLRRCIADHDSRTARAMVVAEIDRDAGGFLYAIALREPRSDFWDIDFPSPGQADEALARLLMECSFCERREVVYLNELELKSFEARRCVARVCKHCSAPSVWIEARVEQTATAEPHAGVDALPEDRTQPSRNKPRVKARILACIRRRGFQEEVAVCEDLSRGGVAFRSRNQYPEGTRLEIAVPYSPGSGAIFVPIRVVSSRPIPSAGLHRHGAAYLKSEQA
jgi:PilZ domain